MRFSAICLLVITSSSVSAERGVGRLRKQQHLEFHDEEHAYRLQGRAGSTNLRNLQGGSGSGATKVSKFETEVVDDSPGGEGDARSSKYGGTDEHDAQLLTTEDQTSDEARDYDPDPTPAPYDEPSPYDEIKDMYMSLDTTGPPTSRPTPGPTREPTKAPSAAPSVSPSVSPSASPSTHPSGAPSADPSVAPSASPSVAPSTPPSAAPSVSPSVAPSETPSESPSSGPSSVPSTVPTVAPSDAPSQAPSDAPSNGPSASPSETPSVLASSTPSVLRSVSPSVVRSAMPSTAPSMTASLNPSTSPSVALSESPSVSPSNSPSEQRSAEPSGEQTISAAPSATLSVAPSSNPSSSPTGAPITPAPTPVPDTGAPVTSAPSTTPPACDVDMNFAGATFCMRENGDPCELLAAIPVDTLLCSGGTNGNPTEMGWIYRPNLCAASTTEQSVFVCTESNDGPPAATGNGRVFIEVIGALGGTVFFSDTVLPGELILMKNPGGGTLNGNVEVKIHDGADRNGIELQTMAMSIRCSGFEDNTIGKLYGSLEFASYIDGSGTAVTGFETLTYLHRIINEGDAEFTFEAFGRGQSSASGLTTTDITPVDNQVLVGAEVDVRHEYNVLLVGGNVFSISGFVTGTTAAGGTCSASGGRDFLSVPPAPAPTQPPTTPAPTPSPTTLAPTVSPITPAPTTLAPIPTFAPITPIPTAAPTTAAPITAPPLGSCFLSTEVRCSNGATPCEDIPALSDDDLQCNVGGDPQQLGWFYRGVGCDATNTAQTIGCMDSDGGPPSAVDDGQVFVEVQGVNTNRVYHFSSVLPGEYLIWADTDSLPIEESISVDIYEGSNQAGRKLQTMVFNVGCGVNDENIKIGDSFGALEFGSYSGSNGQFVQGFVDVLYTFTVQNTGREDFELTEFTSNIGSVTEDLVPRPPRNLIAAEGGSFSNLVIFTVSLARQSTVDAFVVASGLVLDNNSTCTSTSDTYSFNVV